MHACIDPDLYGHKLLHHGTLLQVLVARFVIYYYTRHSLEQLQLKFLISLFSIFLVLLLQMTEPIGI